MNDGAKTVLIAAAINPGLISSLFSFFGITFLVLIGVGVIEGGMRMWQRLPVGTWVILLILVFLYKLVNYLLDARKQKVESQELTDNKSFSMIILNIFSRFFLLTPIYVLWVSGLLTIAKTNWTSLLIGLISVAILYFVYDFLKPFTK